MLVQRCERRAIIKPSDMTTRQLHCGIGQVCHPLSVDTLASKLALRSAAELARGRFYVLSIKSVYFRELYLDFGRLFEGF